MSRSPSRSEKSVRKGCLHQTQALGFVLSELKEARLAPIVSFKAGHKCMTRTATIRFELKQERHGMNRENVNVVDAISREKNVERDVVWGRGSGLWRKPPKKLYTGEVDIRRRRSIVTVAITKPSVAGMWCPMRRRLQLPIRKSALHEKEAN